MCGSGDDMSMRQWAWMCASCYQSGNVRHIDHQQRANFVHN
ncbi:Uncharacterised protein [Vibrio cholerae]|nr:Uncharacterised protein [Vibrio cholerae]